MMSLGEFKIGQQFWMSGQAWRCTDIGSRVATAIKLDKEDSSWYNGPPYSVLERVIDEYDREACSAEFDDYQRFCRDQWLKSGEVHS